MLVHGKPVNKDFTRGYSIMKSKKIVLYAYSILFLCILAIIISIHVGRGEQVVDYGLQDYDALSIQWTDVDGNPIDFQELESMVDPITHTVSIYYHPQSISDDVSFIYRSKNVSTRILMNGEVLYETHVLDHPLYNDSPGTRWNVVALNSSDTPQTLEMQITTAYSNRAIVDNFYIGDAANILLHIIKNKLWAVIISFLIIMAGAFLLVVNYPLNAHREHKNHRLAYLGLAAILAGIWCLIETNVCQLFTNDVQIIQTIGNVSLALVVVPLFLYLETSYHIFRNLFMQIICYISLCNLALSIVLHCLNILDFHETLFAAVYLAIITIALIICILQEHAHMRKRQRQTTEHRLEMAGIFILTFTLLIELIRYMLYDIIDRARIIRIGILGLIICLGVSNLLAIVRLIKQGMRVNLISKLAYTDGLTNLNNRTAYLEQLEKYTAMDLVQLGIAFLDINNLKQINDNLGHEYGDELIIAAANVMRSSFGKYGKIYRIGGDEFCVLFVGKDTSALYERALIDFYQKLDACNSSGEHPFKLEIAIGFAHCNQATKEKIQVVQHTADQRMYENKTALKKSKNHCISFAP